jgi:hypothetical protein
VGEARLVELLQDPEPDVRFNAATGLARHGRAEGAVILIEMLQVSDSSAGFVGTTSARREEWKLQIIRRNALRSIQSLAERRPQSVSCAMLAAVRQLADASDDRLIQDQASRTLQALEALTSGRSSGL